MLGILWRSGSYSAGGPPRPASVVEAVSWLICLSFGSTFCKVENSNLHRIVRVGLDNLWLALSVALHAR